MRQRWWPVGVIRQRASARLMTSSSLRVSRAAWVTDDVAARSGDGELGATNDFRVQVAQAAVLGSAETWSMMKPDRHLHLA
jgi:hypothetical protein